MSANPSDPLRLVRSAIATLSPYQSARSENLLASVCLDANESPWSGNRHCGGEADNRYPAPQPAGLIQSLAGIYGVPASHLLLTRGIDEGLDTLFRSFCEPGIDNIVIHPPTYGYYEVCASIQNCKVKYAPLDDVTFALNAQRMSRAIDDHTKIVILCNPNNPTGNLLEPTAIKALIEETRGRCLLLIDEAYIEFAASSSLLTCALAYSHVIVMRTFSKAWGLAGARIGVTIAAPEIIEVLRRVLAPYPLSRPSIRAVESAVNNEGLTELASRVKQLHELRGELALALASCPSVLQIFPSSTNFLLVRVTHPKEIVQNLRRSGISIRDRSDSISGCIRVTVGAEGDHQRLVEALKGIEL